MSNGDYPDEVKENLKFGTVYNPCWMSGRVPFMVYKGETAINVFKLHQYHGAGTIITTARNKTFAVSMHNHEHTTFKVCYYFLEQ